MNSPRTLRLPSAARSHSSSAFGPLLALVLLSLGCRQLQSPAREGPPDVRLGMVVSPRARPEYETMPTPLVYGGGFLNKWLVFETLVNLERDGSVVPGLARSWTSSPDARTWTFELRPDARFHSGAPCDAAAVKAHMERWLGGTEDAFQPLATRLASLHVRGPHTLEFRLTEPLDLPPDLAIVNPMAIVGPGAARGEVRPVLDGTGPWSLRAFEPMRAFHLRRNDAYDGPRPVCAELELRLYPAATARDAIGLWALRRGEIDALVEDWVPKIPRAAALRLAKDERFVLERSPGSATRLLTFNAARAPFASADCRRRVAAAVVREPLIEAVEAGLARPARTLFSPELRGWPAAPPLTAAPGPATEHVRAELLVGEASPEDMRLAFLLRTQLAQAGVDVELVFVDGGEADRRLWAGEFDLALAWTWGVPYDPRVTLHSRFLPQPSEPTAVETPPFYTSPELSALVHEYLCATASEARARLASSIDALLAIDAAVVPLYVPERIALRRRELTGLDIGGHGYEVGLERLALVRATDE